MRRVNERFLWNTTRSSANLDLEDRWYLDAFTDGNGIELDGREFTYGRAVDAGPPLKMGTWKDERIIETRPPLRLSLYRKRTGAPLDFTFTGENVPVVTSRVAEILAAVANADIQRIPVYVEGQKESYEIINVVSCIPCVDRDHCDADWWTETDDRPEKIGRAKLMAKLAIDPTKTRGANLLRPKEWDLAIVASEPIKKALEKAKVSGIRFTKVTL